MTSPSMLDEIADPSAPKLYTCPCCKFSFRKLASYVDHLIKMRNEIEAAIKDAAKANPT